MRIEKIKLLRDLEELADEFEGLAEAAELRGDMGSYRTFKYCRDRVEDVVEDHDE